MLKLISVLCTPELVPSIFVSLLQFIAQKISICFVVREY